VAGDTQQCKGITKSGTRCRRTWSRAEYPGKTFCQDHESQQRRTTAAATRTTKPTAKAKPAGTRKPAAQKPSTQKAVAKPKPAKATQPKAGSASAAKASKPVEPKPSEPKPAEPETDEPEAAPEPVAPEPVAEEPAAPEPVTTEPAPPEPTPTEPPRPPVFRQTSGRTAAIEKVLAAATGAVTDGWQKMVADQLAEILEPEVWAEVRAKSGSRTFCGELAAFAGKLDKTVELPLAVSGPLAKGLVRWWGRAGLRRQVTRRIAAELASRSANPETQVAETARALRICGIWSCVHAGFGLRSCACFRELAAWRTPEDVRERLEDKLDPVLGLS
jgi:hypothetical protein